MTQIRRITALLIVEAIEPVLPFWAERMALAQVAAVPEGDRLGFVILAGEGVELMFQTRESIRGDLPALADMPAASALFIEVGDIDAVARAAEGLELIVPRRRTFYGMDEIVVREPGGHVVTFAQPVPDAAAGT